MIRRILFAFIWAIVFVVFGIIGSAMVAGGIAGANNPADAEKAGAKAGQEVVESYGGFICLGAIFSAFLGAAVGILPGTKPDPVYDDFHGDVEDDLEEV